MPNVPKNEHFLPPDTEILLFTFNIFFLNNHIAWLIILTLKCNSIIKTCLISKKGKITSLLPKKYYKVIKKANKYPLLLICYSGNPEYPWKVACLLNKQYINTDTYIHNIYSTTASFKGKRQNEEINSWYSSPI